MNIKQKLKYTFHDQFYDKWGLDRLKRELFFKRLYLKSFALIIVGVGVYDLTRYLMN